MGFAVDHRTGLGGEDAPQAVDCGRPEIASEAEPTT